MKAGKHLDQAEAVEAIKAEFAKMRRASFWKFLLKWQNFVRLVCGGAAVLLLVLAGLKAADSNLFGSDLKLETLLVALGVAILLPYVTNFEAFGVKLSVKETVDDLSAWNKAFPYYSLGSECEDEDDRMLAEQYYFRSLNECPDFWPSLLGLGSLYEDFATEADDTTQYAKAIVYYRKALEQDKSNVYALNNLAEIYANAPPPIQDPKESIKCADQAWEVSPGFHDAMYHKAEALNNDKRHAEAIETLLQIVNDHGMKKSTHWLIYELSVALSNLHSKAALADLDKDLEDMLKYAQENKEEEDLLQCLGDDRERERFQLKDRSVIESFYKTHLRERGEDPVADFLKRRFPGKVAQGR